MSTAVADRILDTKGYLCPIPVVKAKLALDEMAPSQVLQVLATDPGSQQDFPAFCRETGHLLLATGKEKGVYIFNIRKGGRE